MDADAARRLCVGLSGAYPAITPGYHKQKHWNTVLLDGSPDAGFVRDPVQDSHDLVVDGLSKRVQRELASRAPATSDSSLP